MKIAEIISGLPPPGPIPGARAELRKALIASGKRLAVIDDDPTGMQAVQDVHVYLDWSEETLRRALKSDAPVFFVSVNSRSLKPDKVRALALEAGRNLRRAMQKEGVEVLLASRSDSTLRGHFPYEVEALVEGAGIRPDGIVFAPALFEAGRFTIGDTQWVEQGGEAVPVSQTEFARDPVFSFKNSDLKAWIEEKTDGAIRARDILSISLEKLRRQSLQEIVSDLLKVSHGMPVIVNGAGYEDYDTACLGIQTAEARGKVFVYRCSASFLKSRGGFADRGLLTHDEMSPGGGAGLVIAGSYVDKTSRQLRQLLGYGMVEGMELDVDQLTSDKSREDEVRRVVQGVERKLANGVTTVVYTSRKMAVNGSGDFTETAGRVMAALCELISKIGKVPGYIVAKGGTTSLEVARTAIGAREAHALGQILPGVPVWRLGPESRWPGIPYVVFPGNVGDDTSLLKAVKILEKRLE